MTNTASLSRQYDALAPAERIPLLAAAWGRGDKIEAERLLGSAPTRTWHLPDHFGWVEALHHLGLIHLVQQLDLATLYWQASSAADQPFAGRADRRREKRCWDAMRLLAYSCSVRADAWKRFG